MLKKHIIKIIELTTYISFGTLIACAVWYLVTLLSRGEAIASASMPYITLGRFRFWASCAPWARTSP